MTVKWDALALSSDPAIPVELAVVGHLGWDVVQSGTRSGVRKPGGSLLHFLSGLAFAKQTATAYTWTDEKLVHMVTQDMLPPWLNVVNTPVADAPEFGITYEGEDVVSFTLKNLSMPPEVAHARVAAGHIHFCAMPLADVGKLLSAWRPLRWSMQLHGTMLSQIPSWYWDQGPPGLIFCNAAERGAAEELRWMQSPEITWVVTRRAGVEVFRGSQLHSEYTFTPADDVVDPTGAGDALAGATLGARLRGVPISAAVRFGTGVAALSLFDFASGSLNAWWNSSQGSPSGYRVGDLDHR